MNPWEAGLKKRDSNGTVEKIGTQKIPQKPCVSLCGKNGCPSRGRTYDQVINSYLLWLFLPVLKCLLVFSLMPSFS